MHIHTLASTSPTPGLRCVPPALSAAGMAPWPPHRPHLACAACRQHCLQQAPHRRAAVAHTSQRRGAVIPPADRFSAAQQADEAVRGARRGEAPPQLQRRQEATRWVLPAVFTPRQHLSVHARHRRVGRSGTRLGMAG
eukprot:269487-Chlamydomonas_euryale.AAC.2